MLKHKQSTVQGYFLCYYIPSRNDVTILSNLLISFKNNEPTDIIDEFCEWASTELSKEKIKVSIIVRALRSKETKVNTEIALDILGHRLATSLGASYKHDILKKTRFTYPLKRLEFNERPTEINNTYYFDYDCSEEDSILIIDDIYTSGATISEIIRSIRVKAPDIPICFFTLGKTDFQFNMNKKILLPGYIYERNIDKLEEPVGEYVYL
ncbi:MAG TPA: hypothetical protein VNB90_14665 [Cytophagaceae bacterium]|jgi:predicted amidophosphoribosyltransferase|nr:hypothetical protein [Cytophagaceae bacterium]